MPDQDRATQTTGGIDEDYGVLLRENARLRDEIAWLRRDNDALQREVARSRGAGDERLSIARPEPDRGAPVLDNNPRSESTTGAPPAAFIPPPLPMSGVGVTQQGLDFGAVAQLTPDKLDGLPYGLITLDARGRVIHYNDTESRLVGLPKDRVIGRNFFRDIAPCTRIREFQGRFEELAADPIGVRVQTFDFVFKFAKGEQHVSVVMTPGRIRGQFHLALLRRAR